MLLRILFIRFSKMFLLVLFADILLFFILIKCYTNLSNCLEAQHHDKILYLV